MSHLFIDTTTGFMIYTMMNRTKGKIFIMVYTLIQKFNISLFMSFGGVQGVCQKFVNVLV